MASLEVTSAPVFMDVSGAKSCLARVRLPNHGPMLAEVYHVREDGVLAPISTSAPELPPGLLAMKLLYTSSQVEDIKAELTAELTTEKVKNAVLRLANKRIRHATESGMARKDEIEGGDMLATDKNQASTATQRQCCPTLSIASAVASPTSVTSSYMPEADRKRLVEILGEKITNILLGRFETKGNLSPRPFVKTLPMSNPRDRAIAHEIIERVWGKRLYHETDRKTCCMYIWVPGSNVPAKLLRAHEFHQSQHRDEASATPLVITKRHIPATSATIAATKSTGKFHYTDATEAPITRAAGDTATSKPVLSRITIASHGPTVPKVKTEATAAWSSFATGNIERRTQAEQVASYLARRKLVKDEYEARKAIRDAEEATKRTPEFVAAAQAAAEKQAAREKEEAIKAKNAYKAPENWMPPHLRHRAV